MKCSTYFGQNSLRVTFEAELGNRELKVLLQSASVGFKQNVNQNLYIHETGMVAPVD